MDELNQVASDSAVDEETKQVVAHFCSMIPQPDMFSQLICTTFGKQV